MLPCILLWGEKKNVPNTRQCRKKNFFIKPRRAYRPNGNSNSQSEVVKTVRNSYKQLETVTSYCYRLVPTPCLYRRMTVSSWVSVGPSNWHKLCTNIYNVMWDPEPRHVPLSTSTFHIHIHSIHIHFPHPLNPIHPSIFHLIQFITHTHHSHTSIIFLKNCPNSFISSNFIPLNYS